MRPRINVYHETPETLCNTKLHCVIIVGRILFLIHLRLGFTWSSDLWRTFQAWCIDPFFIFVSIFGARRFQGCSQTLDHEEVHYWNDQMFNAQIRYREGKDHKIIYEASI